MAYRFRRKESAAEGFRRIVREQTAAAVSFLADQGTDASERVHEARRHLKRLRAILELVRHAAEPQLIEAEQEVLRTAGHRLALTRDADVCLATFETLAATARFAERRRLLAYFQKRSRDARRRLGNGKLAAIASLTRKSGFRIAEANLNAEGWSLFQRDLERSLRHARKLRPGSKEQADDAALHEWRKALKRLFHQLELFRPMLGKAQRVLLAAIERLCDVLGEIHDLYVLENSLREYYLKVAGPGGMDFLQSLINARRKLLLRRACKLGAAVFRDKPKTVLRRIHRAWKRARKDRA
jgi:CHAD domain-containing protein